MKKIIFTTALLIAATFGFTQTCIPDTLCITGVARYANNQPVADTTIDVQIEISEGFPLGNNSNVRYCELLLNITINSFGEFTACFGAPNYICPPHGTLPTNDWTKCELHYRLGWRITGQTLITTIVTSKFGTVPYAFAARTAEKVVGAQGATNGQVLTWNGTAWVPGNNGSGTPQTISLSGQTLTLSNGGGSVNLPSASGGVPEGTVIAYAGASIPTGWELCDGRPLVRTGTYAKLFGAIGIAWGQGDGVNTFNLPDLRGMFLRGVTGTSPNDPDVNSRTSNGLNAKNAVGSVQGDAFQGHQHGARIANSWNGQSFPVYQSSDAANRGTQITETIESDGTNGTPRVSSETRPKNVYVYYIIKY